MSQANRYAFYFDSSFCSGCKACQVACKDKNNLEVGRLWRKVYEVTGGEWHQHGQIWIPDIFSYNVSLACNHCERPICLEVCPTGAIHKREDGIVLIKDTRCIGCGYCKWVCPYNAPQFDPGTGKMTKCNSCYDYIDIGKLPVCVAACPMRALEFGEYDKLAEKHTYIQGVYPLPENSLTNPSVLIKPHQDAGRACKQPARITNIEEL
ncbi:DMSO/selenate family reductase complex B subunit [Chloroflexota bacterium]